MFARLFAFVCLCCGAITAQTIELAQPSRIVIGSSDQGGWHITELNSISSSESRLRRISVDFDCDAPHLYAADEEVLSQESVPHLAVQADVCVSEAKLSALVLSLRRKKRKDSNDSDEDDDGTIGSKRMEVHCGTDVVVHNLLRSNSFRFSVLKSKEPRIAAIWALADELEKRTWAIRKTDNLTETEREQVEVSDREHMLSAAAELRAGKFDIVLEDVLDRQQEDVRRKLSDLMPSPEEAIKPENYGEVRNIDHLGVLRSVLVSYPRMALVARIQGDVKAEIAIDPSSGRVISTKVISGHPIFGEDTIRSLNKFQFAYPYSGDNPLVVTVHFEVRCAPLIETTVSRVSRKAAKEKKKSKQ